MICLIASKLEEDVYNHKDCWKVGDDLEEDQFSLAYGLARSIRVRVEFYLERTIGVRIPLNSKDSVLRVI